MTIWIVTAFDPVPYVDTDLRLLRYGHLAKKLSAAGHNIVFWTSTFAHWKKSNRFERDTSISLPGGITANFLFAQPYKRNISLARIRHNRGVARVFWQQAQKETAPDIILAALPSLELAEAAAKVSIRYGVPFLCDVQDVWPDTYLMPFPGLLRPIVKPLLAREYSRVARTLRSAYSLSAVSQTYLSWAGKYRERRFQERDRVFPIGYQAPTGELRAVAAASAGGFAAEHRIRLGATVAVFLGQFGASYDLETVIRAADNVRRSGQADIQVILAGHGPYDTKLRNKAAHVENVRFTGWLDYKEGLALLACARIGLAPYRSCATQSLPCKPFEYMCAGVPILNSLPGELSRLVRDEKIGLNYEAGDHQALSRALLRMSEDRHFASLSAKRSIQLYQARFDSEVIYEEMAKYISNVSGHQRG